MARDEEIIYDHMVNLPSPLVDRVDPLGLYDDLFAPLRDSGLIKGMVTPLYQYQRAAVAQMLHQELYPPDYMPTLGELPLDTYPPELQSEPIACPYNCGKHHYSPVVNLLPDGMETFEDTTAVRTRGGILAEDSRTGKILEFLALILLTKDQPACPTALDVPFTKAVCCLTYQKYLDHTLLPPYSYPVRNPKRNGESDDVVEFDDDDEMIKAEPCFLPGKGIVAPLRYLALREVVHQPCIARKALGGILPPDLQQLMRFSGIRYIEDREFTESYFKNPDRPITDSVEQHYQDVVLFPEASPDLPKFKAVLPSISCQDPKNWKRLDKAIPMSCHRYYPRPPMPTQPSRATLVVLPRSSINAWLSEINKHMAPGTLKYVTVRSRSEPSITVLAESDLVFISTPRLNILHESQTRFPRTYFRGIHATLSTNALTYYVHGYLKIPPFNFDHIWGQAGKLFQENPRCSNARSLLNWVLSTYVVRNRSEDVRREITLPSLTKRTVYLDCGHYERHCSNFILADAIYGRRWIPPECGVDFLDYYHWLTCCPYYYVHGLRCKWRTPRSCGSDGVSLSRSHRSLKELLKLPSENRLHRTEINLFQQCLRWLEPGMSYKNHRRYDGYGKVRYYVDAWPDSSPRSLRIQESSRTVSDRKYSDDDTDLLPETGDRPSSSLALNLSAPILNDWEVKSVASRLQAFYKNSDSIREVDTASNAPIDDETDRAGAPGTNIEVHRAMKSLAIRGCSSAKLTYLANQLRLCAPHEKSVVYVNTKADMKAVSEFLNLIGIKSIVLSHNIWFDCPHNSYCLYGLDADGTWDGNVVKFITDNDCRVLVLPTWRAISGIDLSIASRVYFFSPVWYDLIEAQAIRRVHHMGQTRAVHVETLVIRDTLEDTALSFKSKPFYEGDFKARTLEAKEDDMVMNDLAYDDDSNELSDQELCPADKTENIEGTVNNTSSAQPTFSDINRRPGPQNFFDEPIPLLSLQV
ncbi:hypothetical protein IWQ61_004332 [Dispira simplex]|nr:hypothetical protein IWQ61_004332 [Dispira simplex]